jgi:hypothetical protein
MRENQGEWTMRKRLTERKAARSLKAELAEMERMLEAMDQDAELEAEAEELADEESEIVTEGMEEPVDSEELEGQNEKANDNWPLEARQKFAAGLLDLAKSILADEDED